MNAIQDAFGTYIELVMLVHARNSNSRREREIFFQMQLSNGSGKEAPRQSALDLARQWKTLLGHPGSSNKAGLALTLGVSRARVTQVLSVLDAPELIRQRLE